MVIGRGDVYWADLGEPGDSTPGKRRPVLVVQADEYNASRIATVLIAIVTSNLAVADWPGNVLLTAAAAGLPKDSAVNVSQLVTMNRYELVERAGQVPADVMQEVDAGLARVLGLP